ncbi:MAG: hypothetical protein KAI03_06860 [Candidatus Aureabacteria bacterium]|nr:hypothetical protein [Candidatus Auribacterota bacterium]
MNKLGIALIFFVLSCSLNSVLYAEKTVYIVPDEETFLYYIGEWSAQNRFPVFIDETQYYKKFVRAYAPDLVKKVESKKIGGITIDSIFRSLAASFSDKGIEDIPLGEGFKNFSKLIGLNSMPDGIVLMKEGAKEIFAGAALAAYYNQDVFFYESGFSLTDAINRKDMNDIKNAVIGFMKDKGYSYKGRSGVEYITIAQGMPFVYNPGMSVDDALVRETLTSDDIYAYVGRLMEVEEGAAVYQAMCSLFLETDRALFFDTWDIAWGFQTGYAAWQFFGKVPTLNIALPEANINYWRKFLKSNLDASFIWINTSGGPRDWGGSGNASDIPSCSPCCVYFAHSNSARNPDDPDTICGRWLRNGAYYYVGAIKEPYAQSFQEPFNVVKGLLAGETFGEAFQAKQFLPGRFRIPWKQIYIGNPRAKLRFKKNNSEEFDRFKEVFIQIKNRNFNMSIKLMEDYVRDFEDFYLSTQVWQFLKELYFLDFYQSRYPDKRFLREETFIRDWVLNLTPPVIQGKNSILSKEGNMYIFYLKNRYFMAEDKKNLKFLIGEEIFRVEGCLTPAI